MTAKFSATNTTSYIDCGTVAIPTGDWALFYGVNIGTLGGAQSHMQVCIGTASDTVEGDNANITIGTSNTTAGSAWEKNQLMATGKDSTGVDFGTRPVATYMGSATTINALSGLSMSASGNTLVVLQKRGTNVELWQVYRNHTAVLMHQSFTMTAWAGFSGKACLLGALNHLTKTGYMQYSSAIQRFGKVKKSLTPAQMERIACGANPVTLLSMNSTDDDLYWPFDDAVALVNGATAADIVQGQTATVVGSSWQPPTQIIPIAETTNDVRLLQRDIYHTPVSPGPIRLDGTYRATGTTIDVQARLLNSSTQAVLQDWTTIAQSVTGGKWTGSLAGITRQLLDYEINIRLIVDDVAQTAQAGYVCQSGLVIQHLGQSLNEYMRFQGAVGTGTIPTNIFSFVPSSVPPTAGGTNYLTAPFKAFARGKAPMYKFQIGYGEMHLADIVSTGAQCRVLMCNDARQGTTVANWLTDANALMTRAAETLTRQGGAFVIWEQGQADPGSAYAAKMTNIYNALTNAVANNATIKFLVSPIALTLDSANNSINLWQTRTAQKNFITAFAPTRPAIRPRRLSAGIVGGVTSTPAAANVYLADNGTNDITLVDNIHETADIAGAGRMAERWAQTVLYLAGAAPYSGLGPTIVSAIWNGTTSIVVTVQHNGGTGLQTPNVADVTGFEVSADGGSSWAQPSAAAISGAAAIALTLASPPAQQPHVRYQYGGPGPTPTAGQTVAERRTQAMIDNPVFDNRSPGLNTALGFPVGFTATPIVTTGP